MHLSGQTWSTDIIAGCSTPPGLLVSGVSQPRLDLQLFLCEVKMTKEEVLAEMKGPKKAGAHVGVLSRVELTRIACVLNPA